VVIKTLDSVALNHPDGVVVLAFSKGILTQNARLIQQTDNGLEMLIGH
jgi:hypothetical protein